MNAPEVVRRYAVTLLDAAVEADILDQVSSDVDGLAATLQSSPDLAEFLSNPLFMGEAQRQVFDQLFAGKLQPLTSNFLSLLIDRRRLNLLPAMLDVFAQLCAERSGMVTAQVRSAVELSSQQAESLQQRLSAFTGRKVQLEIEVDAELKGGVVARIGDTVFDGSLTTQLESLRQRLVGA